MRPTSIVNFERLYLAAVVLGLITTFLLWDESIAMVQAQPGVQLGQGFVVAVVAGGILIQLLLWYFIAHRASVVAKWIFLVLLGLALISLIINVGAGVVLTDIAFLLGLLAFALRAGAGWMLFRPDAKVWFGEDGGPTNPDTSG
jgi:hypothetical protein